MGLLWFIAGAIVGAGGMFLVYKNNKKNFEAAADELETRISNLRAKLDKKE